MEIPKKIEGNGEKIKCQRCGKFVNVLHELVYEWICVDCLNNISYKKEDEEVI
jgi:DNA-directed RNA polymerase subunit RPC12/RpoP